MITIKNTDTQKMILNGRNVRGIFVTAVLLAAVAGTAMTGVLVDQTKIRVRVSVQRHGEAVHEIYNDQIRYANALSGFDRPEFIFFQNSTKEVVLANTTSVTEKAILPMLIDLGENYHLAGNDVMTVEFNTTGWASDASVSSVTSYLEATSVDYLGTDSSNTEWVIYNIQAGKTGDSVSLGDGVTDILFYNSDKTDILDASAPLSNVSIDSNEFKALNITQNTLLGRRLAQFVTKAEADLRYQSFMLYKGDSINNCRVELSLNGSNVNASACYIIARKKVFTPNSLNRSIQFDAKQAAVKLNTAGLHSVANTVLSKANLASL